MLPVMEDRKTRDELLALLEEKLRGIAERISAALMDLSDKGSFDPEDASDVEAVFQALERLIERRWEKDMARWVTMENGKKRLDVTGEETPDERVLHESNMKEMLESRKPPSAPAEWNPLTTCLTTGMTAEEAREVFPTRAAWDGWKKKRGLVETSPAELKQHIGARPSIEKKLEKVAEDVTKEAIERASSGVSDEELRQVTAPPPVHIRPRRTRPGDLGEDGLPPDNGDFANDVGPIKSSMDPISKGGERGYAGDELIAEEYEIAKRSHQSGTISRLAGVS